jgi:tripartite-type tricarboxylate transporter receptor subunit TctC
MRYIFAAALALVLVVPASAQQFPSKPIRIVSPFAPGGGNDVISRTIAAKLTETLKQQVLVENRAGANGIVGTEVAARSAPDGYTIVLIPSGHTVNASLYKKLPYDSIRDFTPITLVGSSPLLLVVHPTLPVKSVKELIRFAQARPGQLTYASAGIGSSGHLAAALFDTLTGTKMVHVPYKGNALALSDLIGGQVFLNFATTASVMPHIKSGRLRALATTGAQRSAALPEIPTVAESGMKDFAFVSWYGLWGPKNLPADISTKLQTNIAKVLALPDVKARLNGIGFDPIGSSGEQFATYSRDEMAKYEKIIKEAKIKVE